MFPRTMSRDDGHDTGLKRGLFPPGCVTITQIAIAAFILVDEVRHMTVRRRVLGLKIY